MTLIISFGVSLLFHILVLTPSLTSSAYAMEHSQEGQGIKRKHEELTLKKPIDTKVVKAPTTEPPSKQVKAGSLPSSLRDEEEDSEEREETEEYLETPSTFTEKANNADKLEVTIYNVGQGNCVLLKYPNFSLEKEDHYVLVDCGTSEHQAKERKELENIPMINIDKVATSIRNKTKGKKVTVLVSHLDMDHTDLIPYIFPEARENMNVIIPAETGGQNERTEKFDGWVRKFSDKILGQPIIIEDNDLSLLKKELEGLPLIPFIINAGTETGESTTKSNPNSLIIQAKPNYESNCSITLTGDATGLTTHEVVKDYPPQSLNTTFLLACHHGAKGEGCNNEEWIKKTQPQSVIFSAGYRKIFYHPRQEIVERYYRFSEFLEKANSHPLYSFKNDQLELSDMDKAIFSTLNEGTIEITFEGDKFTFQTEVHERPWQGSCIKLPSNFSNLSNEQK